MRGRRIFLDMDGVISEFDDHVRAYYGMPPRSPKDCTYDYNYKEAGRTPQEFWSGLSIEFWSTIPKTPWADELVDLLEPYAPVILSSGAHMQNAYAGKVIWLKENFPQFLNDRSVFVTGAGAKALVCQPEDLLIDDYIKNCLEWGEHGGFAFLIQRPWSFDGDCYRDDHWNLMESAERVLASWSVRQGVVKKSG